MKRRISTILFIVTIIITQIIFVQPLNGLNENVNALDQQFDTNYLSTAEVIPPAPLGGVENIKSNYFKNGGFEQEVGDNQPYDFDSGGTTNIIVDSEYQTEVHAGSYGAYISVEGSEQSASYTDNRRTIPEWGDRAYVDEVLYLDFWYNCKSNPDIASGGNAYVRFQIMSDIGNIYMYYYLSHMSFPSANTTYYGYFDLRGSLDSWININRNFTEDYLAVFPARDISVSYIRTIYFECYSPVHPTSPLVLLFDDVSLTNNTAFDYFADNGDFEDGDSDPWSTYNTDSGSAYLTENDYTEGSKSMNLTSYSTRADSYSTSYVSRYYSQAYRNFPKGLFAHQAGEYIIEFDWKYTDTSPTTLLEYAYFYLACQNESYQTNLFIMLGDSTDSIAHFSNYTTASYSIYYIKAGNFSVKNTWNHFSFDYFELLLSLGMSNLPSNTMQFTTYSEGLDAKVELLIDELAFNIYPLSDPGFENNWEWHSNDPLLAWLTNYNGYYVNVTTDAYSGNYAANLTSYGGVEAFCHREMWLPVDNNQFIDFRYRIDELTSNGVSGVSSHITLYIDDGLRTVYYILGKNDISGYTNSSDRVCYFVEDFNTTGVWLNLYRNVSRDIVDYFGTAYDWNITRVRLNNNAIGTNKVTTIFDDLHFVEDNAGPTISNVLQTPTSVDYTDPVTITADIIDSSGVKDVILYYSLNANPYTKLTMTYNGGDEYEATIPAADYGTTVYYYIQANDTYDFSTNGPIGYPESYYVYDVIPPTLEVEAPPQHSVIKGDVIFNITAYDLGSGIDHFEIKINFISVYNEPDAPVSYIWVTTDYPDQNHTISFYVEDVQGSSHELTFYYKIDNIPDTTNVGALFSGLISLGLVAITSTMVIYLSERRKKYL
jgi:hypothetical protein